MIKAKNSLMVNELPIIPKNYPLLIFASNKKKFRTFLEQIITAGETAYIRYAYTVRPQTTKEVLLMAGILSRLPREDVEFMINDIGPDMLAIMQPEDVLKGMDEARQDKLLALFSPEKRLAGLSPEERLSGISLEERLSGISLEERLSSLSPEDILKGINAEQRQRLFEALSKMGPSDKGEV